LSKAGWHQGSPAKSEDVYWNVTWRTWHRDFQIRQNVEICSSLENWFASDKSMKTQ
jgi:hypothetical protein